MGDSKKIGNEPCPKCGSKDNLVRYDDGHAHCFGMGCGYFEKGEGSPAETKKKPKGSLSFSGTVTDLPARKINEATCRFFQYRYGEVSGKEAQLAYYLNAERQPVAAKVRFAPKADGKKDFTIIGDPSQMTLYGQWLWASGGRMVVVTEGEIDCLSVSQLQENKWPVVSVPNGAQGAARDIKKQLEWLNSFDSVVFMFDMDEPGQKAAIECAELLAPGKAKIAKLPLKDANECLQQGRGQDVIRAMWNADPYRPDGIINGDELWDEIANSEEAEAIPYPWDGLNEKTHGLRFYELVTITAGSGIGKSAVVREIAYDILKRGHRVGMIMLEEAVKTTALSIMGLELNKRITITGRKDIPVEELRAAYINTVGSGRCYLYDHFGSTAVDRLLSRVRYLARGLDCKYIILDHLSIVVSSMEEDGDERKLIDRTMTMLRTLVQETGIALIIVSHLKRPEGKGHEEGGRTSLAQLRGSHAIAQLSDIVIGLERNQQGDNPNELLLRVLKNRFSGETGEAGSLFYDGDTGRLTTMPAINTEGGF